MRDVHHGRRAFEQATAARGEQRVAGEHRVFHQIGDRAGGVSRDVQRSEREARRFEGLLVLEAMGLSRDPAAVGVGRVAVHLQIVEARTQLLVAPHVVPVVVRAEDPHQREPRRLEGRDDRGGLARIDDQGAIAAVGVDQVGEVVSQAGNGRDLHRAQGT